ncbi:hypothetical protein [Streptomyces microflavus]|uniref:hypothetical protein n=1 Tax=Streptomyces microflavus TaxID=1919 RepID=UPI0033DC851B
MVLVWGVATSAALAFPASASATDIIGVGNSAHDNSCTNRGGPWTSAASGFAAGTVSDLIAAAPIAIPTNQCGGLGSPLIDQEVQNVANCTVAVLGTSQCVGNNFQTGGSLNGGIASGGSTIG